ncbi:MAG: thiamine pyrophosphate-binding protein [Legionella sp.]|nr:thiamine pyrophosphate-binding protein [Legionella sp.]
MNIAEHICNYLALYNVHHIFGYPGASILPLMDAIEKHVDLNWVLMRNELAASLAASAHGKITKKISVCMATSGPGATNLITGLLDAELDCSPVLAITGLTATVRHGLSHFQDVDQAQLLESCCGFNAVCEHPDQVPQLLQTAIGYIIRHNRPAHLSIAADIQLIEFTDTQLASAKMHYKQLHRSLLLLSPPEGAIKIVAETIDSTPKIVIAVGARAYGAGKNIELFAEKIGAPIISTFAGKGIVRENHPLYLGVLGLFGAPANGNAFDSIHEAEVIIAFGVDDLVYFLTDKRIDQVRELIQCESNITSLNYQFIQKRILLGDINEIAAKLTAEITARPYNIQKIEQIPIIKKTQFVHQEVFFTKLNSFLNSDKTIIALDIGDCVVWATQYLILESYQSVIVSNRLGTMGFCLPALIAAKLAKPDHLVLGICGDGGLQMVLAELLTAAQCNLNIILFVFCNNVLQRVVAQQKKMYGTTLLNPDFDALAKSCNITGITISNNSEIEERLKLAFSIKKGPVLVSVHTDPNIYAPMVSWN